MIGVYDYTVLLTYMSLLSAVGGIIVSLTPFSGAAAHPFIGVFFLMFCGLCDAFDGRVARRKKNRTDFAKKYGIQIDSLTDIVAFGILPACIGAAMLRVSPMFESCKNALSAPLGTALTVLLFAVLMLYALASLIRLAYFNVTEEERQKTDDSCRKYYTGLPVTSSAIIFPTVLLLQYLLPLDITFIFFAVMLFTAFAFVGKFSVRKPGLRAIEIMVLIGLVEFVVMLVFRFFINR